MSMKIITCSITIEELNKLAGDLFGDFIKAVVDEKKGIMVVGGELHADEEALLLEEGSCQKDLWGVNLYPAKPKEEWIEFDSMINVRPSQGNRSRGIEYPEVRIRIKEIIDKLVVPERP